MSELRIAIVVPFLDEERYLPELLASLAAQTRRADVVVLADDGSTDGSRALAEAFAARHPGAVVLTRPPRPVGRDRLAGGAAIRAFARGVEQIEGHWDVVAKVDADLRLNPRLLETLERELHADPGLGMVGTYLGALAGDGSPVRQRCRPEHVEGETKFYRRACYEQIAPLPAMLGWDTIDEVRARLRGWRTASVETPGGDSLHLRSMGGHDGLLRGFRRWGTCAWAYGEHPLHVLAVGVQRLGDRPRVVGGASYVAGWALAALRRMPRAEPEVRREVSRDGLRRLGRRALASIAPRRIAEEASRP
jgi:glycosyltransferase involved in cell wall biosynthesis